MIFFSFFSKNKLLYHFPLDLSPPVASNLNVKINKCFIKIYIKTLSTIT